MRNTKNQLLIIIIINIIYRYCCFVLHLFLAAVRLTIFFHRVIVYTEHVHKNKFFRGRFTTSSRHES